MIYLCSVSLVESNGAISVRLYLVGSVPTIAILRNGTMMLTYGRTADVTKYQLNGGDWGTHPANNYYADPSVITVQVL